VDLLGVIGWPVLDRIRLGPLAISPHGIGIAVGYLLGSIFMLREGRKRGLSEDHMGTILLWALLGAIFGARFFYVVAHFGDFDSLAEMLAIWQGGISLIGGIFGAIAFAYPFMRRFGYRFLQVMDAAAIGLAFGIIFGRIGDLLIGDHLGKPTDFILGWAYRGGNLPGPWQEVAGQWMATLEGTCQTFSRTGAALFAGGCPPQGPALVEGAGVHQTALYDFFIAIGLFLFLRWLNRRPRREGVLIMTFAIVYGAGRVATDFLRVDKHFFGLTGSQWGAILAMALSVLALIWFARRPLPAEGPSDEEGEEALTEGEEHRPRKRRGQQGIDRREPPASSAAGDRRTTDFEPPSEPGDDRR
jgi:phosphatidylglycerol---prolipoprotein diacylglyceryl transferase